MKVLDWYFTGRLSHRGWGKWATIFKIGKIFVFFLDHERLNHAALYTLSFSSLMLPFWVAAVPFSSSASCICLPLPRPCPPPLFIRPAVFFFTSTPVSGSEASETRLLISLVAALLDSSSSSSYPCFLVLLLHELDIELARTLIVWCEHVLKAFYCMHLWEVAVLTDLFFLCCRCWCLKSDDELLQRILSIIQQEHVEESFPIYRSLVSEMFDFKDGQKKRANTPGLVTIWYSTASREW